MTNNEILKADVLDILFENRNKGYGAYLLRKGYNSRMLMALFSGLSLVFLTLLIYVLGENKDTNSSNLNIRKDEVFIRSVQMPLDKPKEPEKPKEVVKPKPQPKVAEIKFTDPNIKKDELVKEPLPPVDELAGKVTSTVNAAGVPDDGLVKVVPVPVTESGTGNSGPTQPEVPFIVQERDPEFPGGAEALKKFLARYLTTPENLEGGEKIVVKIRFKVDKDGAVNTFEIVTSGGDNFDNEVVRVCKKMPRWVPAIQNGINVPVSYVLPVTFIGIEE